MAEKKKPAAKLTVAEKVSKCRHTPAPPKAKEKPEMVKVNLSISKELHRQVRVFAAQEDKNLQESMRELLEVGLVSVESIRREMAKQEQRR